MYQIKLYNKSKAFKDTINPKALKREISFTKQINGGQGQLNLILNLKSTSVDNEFIYIDSNTGNQETYTLIQGDIIEIYQYTLKIETLLYVGYIEEIKNNISNFEEVDLKINGLASLFKRLTYNVGGNYEANINQDTFTTISDVKNFINSNYNYFSIVGSLSGINGNYDLNYNNCFDLINNIKNLTPDYYWYVNNYNIIFKQKPTTAIHTFTLRKNIVELNIEEDGIDIVNYLILIYKTGTKVYQDSSSISTYGKRERVVSNIQIGDLASADDFGNNYISEYKNPKNRISLEINREYLNITNQFLQDMTNNLDTYTDNLENYPLLKSIDTIQPGESCKIRNINKNIGDNLIINKINYRRDTILIDLEESENFIGLIKQNGNN